MGGGGFKGIRACQIYQVFLAALHKGVGRRRRGNWLHGGPVKVKMHCPADNSFI